MVESKEPVSKSFSMVVVVEDAVSCSGQRSLYVDRVCTSGRGMGTAARQSVYHNIHTFSSSFPPANTIFA